MKQLWILSLLLFGLTACGSATTPSTSEPEGEISEPMPSRASHPDLQDLGPAPELTNEVWLNVNAPLRLADLRGKVVALEMWTFG